MKTVCSSAIQFNLPRLRSVAREISLGLTMVANISLFPYISDSATGKLALAT